MRTPGIRSAVAMAVAATSLYAATPADARELPRVRAADYTAAAKYNWGTPLPGSDEFNYTGAPDSSKWSVYGEGGDEGGSGSNCWPGHAGNGRRCANANMVTGEYLRQTGLANGDTAGIASRTNLKYGRWEVRAKMAAESGASGNPYHPVLITWPQSDEWPAGAEYDFLEVNVGDPGASAWIRLGQWSGAYRAVRSGGTTN